MKSILVTGATSGFGKAIAYAFSKLGYELFITGRRQQKLEEIKKDIEKQFNTKVHALCFDISKLHECKKHLSKLTKLDVLVNNAGLALGTDPSKQS